MNVPDDASAGRTSPDRAPSGASAGDRASPFVALLLAGFLALLQWLLAYIAVIVWLSPDAGVDPWVGPWLSELLKKLPPVKLRLFQDTLLSACMAGLGASVFMVRELYINYCFGRKIIDNYEYLQNVHVLRYVLLPISAVILGPIAYNLMLAGLIKLDGSVSVSRPVLVIVCFILGYMYHDTLQFMARLSYGLFAGKNSRERDRQAGQE
jgi:hypothetical protein